MARQKRRRPAGTPESRESQVVSAAMDLAEQQILQGTASSQVVTHFLRLGSQHAELEREKIRKENLLLEAKIENTQSAKRVEQLYDKAIKAMRAYGGQSEEVIDEYEN